MTAAAPGSSCREVELETSDQTYRDPNKERGAA